jgi:hypothetical protein
MAMTKYTHLEINKDIPAPAGYYTPQKEVRLKYDGKEVLYVLRQGCIETSCCGVGSFCSAQVPGYIVSWHAEQNQDGLPVSLVEPITDEATRDTIRKIIKDNEHITQTEFW